MLSSMQLRMIRPPSNVASAPHLPVTADRDPSSVSPHRTIDVSLIQRARFRLSHVSVSHLVTDAVHQVGEPKVMKKHC